MYSSMFLFQINPEKPFTISVIGQLIWREYFYTMSVNNMNYNKMTENPICLNIPWYENTEQLKKWKNVRLINKPLLCKHLLPGAWYKILQVCKKEMPVFIHDILYLAHKLPVSDSVNTISSKPPSLLKLIFGILCNLGRNDHRVIIYYITKTWFGLVHKSFTEANKIILIQRGILKCKF